MRDAQHCAHRERSPRRASTRTPLQDSGCGMNPIKSNNVHTLAQYLMPRVQRYYVRSYHLQLPETEFAHQCQSMLMLTRSAAGCYDRGVAATVRSTVFCGVHLHLVWCIAEHIMKVVFNILTSIIIQVARRRGDPTAAGPTITYLARP